ncbi:hypothetical protein CC78DRAFT_268148 [Lojkania enalia]|uniref:Uncharacterized protein n=1 Tax=Lojkania enalia TaxID=147567 RepID=A0A9P4MZG7_9PLEO|nr:hypothetical protein CC78DRAFT_268148 [Didymosphaeria enalia]
MKHMRFETREDVQTWRARLVGKRIVTSDRSIISECEATADSMWAPRIYYNEKSREGSDGELRYEGQPRSRLLSLPAEIRNCVLSYVVQPKTESHGTEMDGSEKGDATWMNTTAIMFCCKQMYAEARPMAIQRHTFEVEGLPRKTRFRSTERG